jgi:hypothetical protein
MENKNVVYFPVIDRAAVRAFVASENEFQQQALQDGKNIHQVALDRQDDLHAYMATLSPEDLEKFSCLYQQEMAAATQAILDRTAAVSMQNANRHVEAAVGASQVATWASIISFFVFLIILISLFKSYFCPPP